MTKANRIVAALCAAATVVTAGAAGIAVSAANKTTTMTTAVTTSTKSKLPKYIFMFKDDVMSFPQTQISCSPKVISLMSEYLTATAKFCPFP